MPTSSASNGNTPSSAQQQHQDPGLQYLFGSSSSNSSKRPQQQQGATQPMLVMAPLPRDPTEPGGSRDWGAAIGNVETAKLALGALHAAIADAVFLDEDAYTNAATLQRYHQRLQVRLDPLHCRDMLAAGTLLTVLTRWLVCVLDLLCMCAVPAQTHPAAGGRGGGTACGCGPAAGGAAQAAGADTGGRGTGAGAAAGAGEQRRWVQGAHVVWSWASTLGATEAGRRGQAGTVCA